MQLHRHFLEVQFQRCTIVDRVLEGVFRHIATFVLFCSETPEGVLLALVDGCTRQAKEECVRQGYAHTLTQITFLCSVGFIHQENDVLTQVQCFLHIAKQEDGCNQYLPLVLEEEVLQFLFRVGKVKIGNLCSCEVACYLCTQVSSVVHNDYCWSIQLLLLHQHLRGKNHQPRFSRTLEMPNQSLLRSDTSFRASHHTINNGHTTKILLVSTHHFDFLRCFLICSIDREEAVNVKQAKRVNQIPQIVLHALQISMFSLFLCEPRPPFCQRSTYTTIIDFLALSGNIENVRYEHFRQRLLIIYHILCSVCPSHAGFGGSLRFNDNHRNTVDEQHHIEPLSSSIAALRILPLVGHHIAVVCGCCSRIGIEEVDVHIFTIFAKRETILIEEQLAQVLVGGNNIASHTAGNTALHLLNHNLSLFRADLVDSLQSLQEQPVHNNCRLVLAQRVCIYIFIAALLRYLYAHLLCYIVFVKVCHFA